MTEQSKLINQGGYGCIYYPSLPFKTSAPASLSSSRRTQHQQKQTSSKKYISKLQKHNFHSEFEDFIGKVIQDIPCYELFFVPVLKTYQIDLATIKQEYLNDCDAVSKYTKRTTTTAATAATAKDYKSLNRMFIIQKMNYVSGLDLKKYLYKLIETEAHTHHAASASASASASETEDDSDDDDDADDASPPPSQISPSKQKDEHISRSLRKDERQIRKINEYFKIDERELSYHLLSILFDLYERITDSIQLLIKYDIIHYDLKHNNILIDNTTQLPMLIDFGLSIYVKRLLDNPWNEKNETSQTIDSDVMFKSESSKLLQNNYYWKQHFYVHAPEYYLWPLEVHIITFLVNEHHDHDASATPRHDVFTEDDLAVIIYQYIVNNRALQNTSHAFKMKYMELCQEIFKPYTNKPREYIINTLFTKYWNTWDTYANNIMFLKLFYGLTMNTKKMPRPTATASASAHRVTSHKHHAQSPSPTEQRQEIHDPDTLHLVKNKDKIRFDERFQIKLKDKYATNHKKLIDVIQIMLRNIHPNPEKRLTPQETKTFFSSVFYDC
jgi:serine/threonine protein kinase